MQYALRSAVIGLLVVASPSRANADPVAVSGRIDGGDSLLNPVWVEASSTKSHRYRFRVNSPTVGDNIKALTGFFPKELCIVAIQSATVPPAKIPVRMTVSGGRTTPVMLVVREGQPVQLENHDPFLHRVYDVGGKGLGQADMAPTKSRIWTPPGPGSYELRDEYSPSLRSWIVVEPKAHAHTYPDPKGQFTIEVEPGDYQLQAYFAGAAVGKPMPINVTAAKKLSAPLVVGETKAPPKKKQED